MHNSITIPIEIQLTARSRAFIDSLRSIIDAPVPAAPPAPAAPASPATRQAEIPRIGAVWPGQGGIYVGMGRGYEGIPDHHLIVPTDPRAIFEERDLGTYSVDVKGACSNHNGMANTIALADAGSTLCKEILGLEIDGHEDFYLMSRTDASLCMANVPELFEKDWYFTSTQYSASSAWSQFFSHGTQGSSSKSYEGRARAVRRFVL